MLRWRIGDSNNPQPRAPAPLTPVDPPRSCVLGFAQWTAAHHDMNAELWIEPGRFMEYLYSLQGCCSAALQVLQR